MGAPKFTDLSEQVGPYHKKKHPSPSKLHLTLKIIDALSVPTGTQHINFQLRVLLQCAYKPLVRALIPQMLSPNVSIGSGGGWSPCWLERCVATVSVCYVLGANLAGETKYWGIIIDFSFFARRNFFRALFTLLLLIVAKFLFFW